MNRKQIALFLILVLLCGCNHVADTPAATVGTEPTVVQTVPPKTVSTDPVTEPEIEPETEAFTEPSNTDFVNVFDYITNIRVNLAYGTENNFTGTKIYDFSDAYLRYGTVKKLSQACEKLEEYGYGILIWDAYRPVYAQERLWEICPDPRYVSRPGTGSQSHCRGIAVDVTLYDLETGETLEMPTGFDSFTAMADRDYSDCGDEAAENAMLLEDVMESCGFKPYSAEWWHYSDTESYEVETEFDPARYKSYG